MVRFQGRDVSSREVSDDAPNCQEVSDLAIEKTCLTVDIIEELFLLLSESSERGSVRASPVFQGMPSARFEREQPYHPHNFYEYAVLVSFQAR